MAAFSAEAFRARFRIFAEGKAHLASCSQGAASDAALAAIDRFVVSWRSGGAPWDAWMTEVEAARLTFARIIGAEPGEVAVVPNASVGAAIIASALDFDGGRDGIVTSDLEFPSIAHVWLAQAKRGASVAHARHVRGVVPLEAWERLIGPRTRLVSAFHTSYANGARNDLTALGERARERGALFFVDAYQGVGVVPIDVKALGCDALVAGTLKYLCGTPGIAFLYVREELARRLEPTITGWFGRVNPFAFDPLTLDFAPDAQRFQTGTPAIVAAVTAAAAMPLIEAAGVEPIWGHVQRLADRLTERLLSAGFDLFSPVEPAQRGPQVSLYAGDANGLGAALFARGIVASPRGDAVRLSLHGYNTVEDIDRVVAALQELTPTRSGGPR